MKSLDGRVAAITGAGSGLGREHALLLAREGAAVVVNDVGTTAAGEMLADGVVAEIRAAGGVATADYNDIADWEAARRFITDATDAHGGLDVLVNNAGIHREGTVDDVTEADWTQILRVNLGGHIAPLRWATEYWKTQAAAGRRVRASVVNTTSIAGLASHGGPIHYAAAKAGIAQLTINAAWQLAEFGVRVNAVAPAARTPMVEGIRIRPDHSRILNDEPGPLTFGEVLGAREGRFDTYHPANVSPLVAYLASERSTETGRVFDVFGGHVGLLQPWHMVASMDIGERWAVDELASRMHELDVPLEPPHSFMQRES